MVSELLVLDLSGNYHDIGYEYGKAQGDAISRWLEQNQYDLFLKKVGKEQMLRHAKKHVPFIEEYSPELSEMILGIA